MNSGRASLRLRILHLSDLHERGPREREPWRRRRVLGDAWERNLDAIVEDGAIDLICFTGDVADWGLAEEYAAATDFFEQLLARLKLDAERLFVVPGNHDIARKVEEDAWKGLRKALDQGLDPLALSRWMAGIGDVPLGADASWRECVLERQAAYRAWVGGALGRPELLPAKSPHGRLGYRCTLSLRAGAPPVHVIGLDTAWLAGDDADAKRLRLTENQLEQLATDKGRPLDGLRLVLMHHPFDELADGAKTWRLAAEQVDLVLRGHLHETEMSTRSDPDRQIFDLAVGCLYEGHAADQWPNAFQVLSVELGEGAIKGTSHFKGWSSRGHWHDDDSLYRESRGGKLKWEIARAQKKSKASSSAAPENPYDVQTPTMPPRFVGRVKLLRDLAEALDNRRHISIVGDYRIGKSSLLKTWEQKAKAAGRVVRWVSGQEASGRSPGAFVKAVTGIDTPDDADKAVDTLDGWAQGVAPKEIPPLLLVDEADEIIKRFDDRFFQRLRGMMGREAKAIVLVLSTWQEIDKIYEQLERTSPFDNLLEAHWPALLELEAAEEIIAWGRGVLSDADREMMRTWAGRHPFYLQMLGDYLFRAQLDGENEDDARDRFISGASRHLRHLWKVLGSKDREELRACVLGGVMPKRRSLKRRGLVDEQGKPFGQILRAWMEEDDL